MSIIFNNIDKMSFDDLGEESEFIPLMTSEDEEALEKESLPEVLSYTSINKHCFVSRCCNSNKCW